MSTDLDEHIGSRRRRSGIDPGTGIFGAIVLGALTVLVVLVFKMIEAVDEVTADGTPFTCSPSEVDFAESLVEDAAFGALAASFETVDPPTASCNPDASVGQAGSSYRSSRSIQEARDAANHAVASSGWRSLEPGGCYAKEYGEREAVGMLDVEVDRVWFQVFVEPPGDRATAASCD